MASAAYQRRNARARALGYQSYYDYRAHDNGRIPPSEPRLKGQALARARGHRSRADLIRAVRPGSLIMATPGKSFRKRDGTYDRIHITVVGPDGTDQTFTITGPTLRNVDRLARDLERRGGVFSPSPSLDLRRVNDD